MSAARIATLAFAALAACAPAAQLGPTLPNGSQWRALRAELAALQARRGPDSYSMNLSLTVEHEQLGRRMRARGTVAVLANVGVRMILLGPGGTTAMDLWSCRDAYRLAIPAADLLRRGDASTPREEQRGLPIAFLRWWFLRPYSGRPLFAVAQGGFPRFLLRDDDGALLDIRRRAKSVMVTRSLRDAIDTIEAGAEACGRASYVHRPSRMRIEIECERINPNPPPARAFTDPDDPARTCAGP